jgi:gliding motility-associated-like protein
VPNVITPNGDGINDILTISYSSVSNFYFQVFNRDGQKIFESSSVNICWDGRTNAGVLVSDGTYYYVLRATTDDGVVHDQAGFITVLGSTGNGN